MKPMRSVATAALLSATLCCGQTMLQDPRKIADAEKLLETLQGDRLTCDVTPAKPTVHFSLRLEAGYIYEVPMKQYRGNGHGWAVLTRVTPENGSPVYLADAFQLPPVPETKMEAQGGGSFFVGEGRYLVKWLLFDEKGRTCRKEWKINARLGSAVRKIDPLMPPGQVAGLSWSAPSAIERSADAPLSRLTILLDVASMSPFRVMHSASETGVLLDALWALSEELPARQVKLVAFHLAQQKVVFRSDNFTAEAMPDLARAINELQPSQVDVSVLARPRGEVDIVESLANTEALAAQPPDAVIFLGPKVMYTDRLPAGRSDLPATIPRFFYVKCAASPFRAAYRSNPMLDPFRARNVNNPRPDVPASEGLPDLIENIVARMEGKTLYAGSPEEFVKAVSDIKRVILARNPNDHVPPR
jgi:hypothetical protein